jgi:hypothetical protein
VHDNALDFLESVLKPQLRNILVPLLDSDVTIEERVRIANRLLGAQVESREEAVLTLMLSDDPWLKSCAAYAIGTLKLKSLEGELDRWLNAADPLLREYIPKDYKMGVLSRSAAIWSLGLLHAGIPDEALAKQLMERIADDLSGPGNPPEMDQVKHMSAASIVRMKAASQVPDLRKRITPEIVPDRMGMTMRWAVMQLTGEHIPEPSPRRIGKTGWFLEPLDE